MTLIVKPTNIPCCDLRAVPLLSNQFTGNFSSIDITSISYHTEPGNNNALTYLIDLIQLACNEENKLEYESMKHHLESLKGVIKCSDNVTFISV